MTRLETLRQIVAEHQARKVAGVLVDTSTASVCLRVLDACNDANRVKLPALPLPKMARICWQVVA